MIAQQEKQEERQEDGSKQEIDMDDFPCMVITNINNDHLN